MKNYSLKHLSDESLLCSLAGLVARERANTAELLAHIAEVDERRLYAPLAYDSMRAYCVDRLGLSEESAARRIHAAHVAQRFPVVFEMVADGRLHLSAIVTLGPALRRVPESDACQLLHAAARKTRVEIEHLIACRLPREDAPALLQKTDAHVATDAPGRLKLQSVATDAPGRLKRHPVATDAPGRLETSGDSQGTGANGAPNRSPSGCETRHAPGRPEHTKEIAPGRFFLQATISREHHDMLRRAQELLSHQHTSADLAGVIERLIEEGLQRLERKLLAATGRPRASRGTSSPRRIPAEVRRAVRRRDGDRCTFVGMQGRRCEARRLLQFDHIVPVARGGKPTVGNVRLLCREHNRLEAERVFGRGFMEATLETRVAEAKARASAAASAEANDVRPYLRRLGYSDREANRAAAFSDDLADASLEARVRVALSFLNPRAPGPPVTSPARDSSGSPPSGSPARPS